MQRRSFFAALACTSLMALTAPLAAQEAFPTKALRIVVSVAPGGATDLFARKLAEGMSIDLGQPVIVENRPGAGTVLGLREVLAAPADGYTIAAHSSTLNMLVHTIKDLGFDPRKDFKPIGLMALQSSVVSVSGNAPYQTLAELLDEAKKRPGEITFAHGGPAGPQFVIAETLANVAGVKFEGIQYQGVGSSFVDVASGRVDLVASGYSGQASFFPEKQLRPLAVTGDKRIAAIPDVPTLKEQGIDMVSNVWLGLMVPKDVPQERLERLSQALKSALSKPEFIEQAAAQGSDPTFLTPDQTAELFAQEAAAFDDLAARVGFQPQ